MQVQKVVFRPFFFFFFQIKKEKHKILSKIDIPLAKLVNF